jgi:beta-alanine degradation protein BauB
MTRISILVLLVALSGAGGDRGASGAATDDPAVTDGDKYHVLLENEHVRVLRYHDEPGAKTRLHHHPDFVMYALAPFRRQLTFPDGTRRQRIFDTGDLAWMPAQSHIGENIGANPTDVLLVEIKKQCR